VKLAKVKEVVQQMKAEKAQAHVQEENKEKVKRPAKKKKKATKKKAAAKKKL